MGFVIKGRRLHHESGSEDSEEGISLSDSSSYSGSGGSEGSSSSLGTESTGSSGSDDALGSDSEGLDEEDEPEEIRSTVPAGRVSRYDFTEDDWEKDHGTMSETWWDNYYASGQTYVRLPKLP